MRGSKSGAARRSQLSGKDAPPGAALPRRGQDDDPEYIVKLSVRVSMETVKIVKQLPVEFAQAAGAI
jgi:hypothetical protein